jgi:hypothetical protein
VTPAQWTELIDSYVSGRLSADSFKRRFTEAFTLAVQRRLSVPAGVQDLAYVVEAYAGDPTARGHDVADDDDLRRAALGALRDLGWRETPEQPTASPFPPPPASPPAPPPREDGVRGEIRIESIDPEAMRQQARRMTFTFGAIGAAGCLLALLYVGIGVLQLFAVADQIQRVTDLGPVVATIGGLLLAFIPIVGGLIAYFGATDGWGWPNLVAGLVFFAFPLAIFTIGFLQRRNLFGWRRTR